MWDFSCQQSFDSPANCHWTQYVNNFDQEFKYRCPKNYLISGMESYHQNMQEDRRFVFQFSKDTGIWLGNA